jgi:hypothetical protein
MKLKEKYCDLIDNDNGFDNELLTNKCEKIADNFAIEFAEWIEEYQGGTPNSKILKELLQIYKKEKGL